MRYEAARSIESRAKRTERGMTMMIALIVVAVLLFVAVVLLSNAFGSAATENSIRSKLAAFNAAEAGIDQVVDELDKARGQATACANAANPQTMGTLVDGGSYEWCIAYNGIVTGKTAKVRDRANTSRTITVPANTVYAWSSGSGQGGGRGVLIEALIAPSDGMSLPTGAVAAGGDVYLRGDVGVYESSPGAGDATIRANGNIYESAPPRTVQGATYAAGIDQVNGQEGSFPNSPPMPVPSQSQMTAAAGDASNEATGGSTTMPPPKRSVIVNGNVFINGDLQLDSGTIVLSKGKSVFIDGNVCLDDGARLINDGANVWVSGVFSTVGATNGYSVRDAGGTLVVLGSDTSPGCGNTFGSYALQLDPQSNARIGLVYAPNGSIDLAGTGVVVGALDAGDQAYLDSANGGGIRIDAKMSPRVPTYDFKIVSYMEY
jgi:type II secretory pathway pseudopilin PulG